MGVPSRKSAHPVVDLRAQTPETRVRASKSRPFSSDLRAQTRRRPPEPLQPTPFTARSTSAAAVTTSPSDLQRLSTRAPSGRPGRPRTRTRPAEATRPGSRCRCGTAEAPGREGQCGHAGSRIHDRPSPVAQPVQRRPVLAIQPRGHPGDRAQEGQRDELDQGLGARSALPGTDVDQRRQKQHDLPRYCGRFPCA